MSGDGTENEGMRGVRIAELVQLAQDRQIEINVWRGRLHSAEAEVERLQLSERDLSALRFAVEVARGIERNFADDPQVGTREGEATSDVLAAIIARAELLRLRNDEHETENEG